MLSSPAVTAASASKWPDLSDTATISAAVSAFKSESNRLDVLVNNAAIYSEDRKATLETNYFNTIAVTDAFLPLLTQSAATAPNKRARVVIVSSRMGCFDWAKISGDALAALTDHNDLDKINALAKAWSAGDDSTGLSTVAYSTSKALINAYGRYLADRLTKEQIPVDIILTCPGTTKTDMNPAGTKTVEQGADTISWACYDSSVGTGKFYGHRTEIPYDTCDISLMGKV